MLFCGIYLEEESTKEYLKYMYTIVLLLLWQPEDEQEKFDRLQMELLMNNPESAAFHNAQMRTERRVRRNIVKL